MHTACKLHQPTCLVEQQAFHSRKEYSPGMWSVNKSIIEMRIILTVHAHECICQVSQTLRNAHCGHRNRQPLVYCNDEEEEEEEDVLLTSARFAFFTASKLR